MAAQADIDEDALDQFVAARIGRQAIFDKPDRPKLWVVLDELVLHRMIGTPKVTYDQLLQVADMSMRSYISVQVVPVSIGANAGLGGAWRKSSYSGNGGNDCVELADRDGLVLVRDTKQAGAGPILTCRHGLAADDLEAVAASYTAASNGLRRDGDHALDPDVHDPDQACEP